MFAMLAMLVAQTCQECVQNALVASLRAEVHVCKVVNFASMTLYSSMPVCCKRCLIVFGQLSKYWSRVPIHAVVPRTSNIG